MAGFEVTPEGRRNGDRQHQPIRPCRQISHPARICLGFLRGSCPKSVIDDKRFRGNELWFGGLHTYRVAISNQRLTGMEDEKVTFRFRD
jgi:hypothetical protein